jgi:hypothetical protein
LIHQYIRGPIIDYSK